ncbi:MAG: FN3 and LamG domain-containing metallophosphoesterase [Candidatus Symbiothrix sp.]|jgi:hypothetical protein|nr:FN3 and LamG domain-containing metallophosphoesterase [Candidatus Symbiothrix sp.]
MTHKLLISALLMSFGATKISASDITLTFEGDNQPLQKVVVYNVDRACDTTITQAPFTLTLHDSGAGISAPTAESLKIGKVVFDSANRKTLVDVSVAASALVKLSLYNLDGAILKSQSVNLNPGVHTFSIKSGLTGALLLKVEVGKVSQSIKFLNQAAHISGSQIVLTQSVGTRPSKSSALRSSQAGSFSYHAGDSLQYTAYAENYKEVMQADRPDQDKTYSFSFTNDVRFSFAVISDTHFGNTQGDGPAKKVPKALRNLTTKQPLEAIFIVGDLTDGGTTTQYDQFKAVLNATAYVPSSVRKVYMMGNHDHFSTTSAITNYNVLGQPLDQYIVIQGYPFITISQRGSSNCDDVTPSNGTNSYPQAVQDTLRNWLAKAAAECPGKPIFVFTHVPPKYTCYSSWPNVGGVGGEGDGSSWPSWSMKTLNPILNQYPQVVIFGGHSHFPIGDPRSIHQGVNQNSSRQNFYTALNTGSTTYSEINSPCVDEGIHPTGYNNITEGYILNVKYNGDVEIERWDTYRNEEMHPESRWLLRAPHDGTMFAYADKRDADETPTYPNAVLRDGLPAPVFASDAVPTVSNITFSSCTVTFPQATDNDYVFRYFVNIKTTNGTVAQTKKIFSQFYKNSAMPATLSAEVTGLSANTNYIAEVIAYDSYDNTSTPITLPFKTEADNDPANQPPARTGSWLFDDADDLLKAEVGEALIPATAAKPPVEKATAAEANIVAEAGPSADNGAIYVPKNSGFKMIHNIAANGGTKVNDYTLMIDFNARLTNSYYCLIQTTLANTDDGDIFIKKDGTIGLSATGFGYGGSVVADTWNRYVLVVKNGVPTSYLNGVEIKAGSGITVDSRWALDPNGVWLFIDDNSEDDDIHIAEVAIWDSALTAAQVTNLGTIE